MGTLLESGLEENTGVSWLHFLFFLLFPGLDHLCLVALLPDLLHHHAQLFGRPGILKPLFSSENFWLCSFPVCWSLPFPFLLSF